MSARATSPCPTRHAEQIVSQFNSIMAQPELAISEPLLAQFQNFLALLSNNNSSQFAEQVLEHPKVKTLKPHIQQVFAKASSMYEAHWARTIIQAQDPTRVYQQDYPWRDHYRRAVQLEINAVDAVRGGRSEHILMVGSGALPVTSIMLSQKQYRVDNLDIDKTSLELGKSVCERIVSRHTMDFIHNDICAEKNLGRYDVIWLAALVGDQSLKRQILDNLYLNMKTGSVLVVRTACNLRTLLYPAISEDSLLPFSLKLKIQTYADNFHSILVAQKID